MKEQHIQPNQKQGSQDETMLRGASIEEKMEEQIFQDNLQNCSHRGTVLRGPDGSLYFLREEMLEALRVYGKAQERLQEAMETGVGGVENIPHSASSEPISIEPVAYVSGSLLLSDPRNLTAKLPSSRQLAASTIMCPWFCSHEPQ